MDYSTINYLNSISDISVVLVLYNPCTSKLVFFLIEKALTHIFVKAIISSDKLYNRKNLLGLMIKVERKLIIILYIN